MIQAGSSEKIEIYMSPTFLVLFILEVSEYVLRFSENSTKNRHGKSSFFCILSDLWDQCDSIPPAHAKSVIRERTYWAQWFRGQIHCHMSVNYLSNFFQISRFEDGGRRTRERDRELWEVRQFERGQSSRRIQRGRRQDIQRFHGVGAFQSRAEGTDSTDYCLTRDVDVWSVPWLRINEIEILIDVIIPK